MARPGPASKTVKHGRTPNAEWTEVPDEPYTGPSPDLPKLPRRERWHTMVEQWWEQVRSMPHCVLWRPPDWQFAIETAFQKQLYWKMFDQGEATTAQATEIRRREDQLGTTAESRRKLMIRYLGVEEPEFEIEYEPQVVVVEQAEAGSSPATVTTLADRRARLTQRAG